MKRIHYIITLALLCGGMTAHAQTPATTGNVHPEQEKYSDLLTRTADLPAYEVLYHMLTYQRFHPEHAPIYYRMGDVVYSLLPSKDPLHNYAERAELLYKGKLFYGNCLHFLGGKMPRGETFPTIHPAGKRVEYEDVEQYLRARLDTIKRWRAETDTLHDRFYRMVDRYELCRQLFLDFMEKYPSEKLAHLCLTDDDREQLQELTRLTRMVENDKQLFLQALSASPIQRYNPQFRTVNISAYRLDGVTSSDFLANDIPMWDYAGWTAAFLQVQQTTYQTMMRELVQEHTMIAHGIERFRQGMPVQLETNPLIAFRLELIDYNSPLATFLRLEQLVAETTLQAQDSLSADEQLPDGELSARITASLMAQERLAEANTALRTLRQRIDDSTPRKYAFFLKQTEIGTVEQLLSQAEQTIAFQTHLTDLISTQLQQYAQAYPAQFEKVDISDERAASENATLQAK